MLTTAETLASATTAVADRTGLTLRFPDGFAFTFHPIWLREQSDDADSRDARTGQRLSDASSLPLDLAVTAASVAGDEVAVGFGDGATARFAVSQLRAAVDRPRPPELHGERVLWDASLSALPEAAFADVERDPAALRDALGKVAAYGFVLVRGVPVEMDGAARFARLVGPMRETNWGTLADVKFIPEAYDLSMTSRALEPHTDNPYRHPVPGYILLHCLTNDVTGGDSTLSDGFACAAMLKRRDPDAFRALTEIRPNFRYADAEAVLESAGPLIELDSDGEVRQVRFSNRTEQVPALPAGDLDRYYRARREWVRLITGPAMTVGFKLGPGDMLMMDNYRLFHGRSAFQTATGIRHMRQCYLDRDSVSSRYKLLAPS
ncbi:MAG TPA: TauD/TfdA family dioxygenase [Alphaproteobacteria bacterium]|nr:TauD/TfdA family dioxygenase [Alphaproteobacteria bacterium]